MRAEERQRLSQRAAERITGISAAKWRDDRDRDTYYVIDEALVKALAAERAAVVAWLRREGANRLADELESGAAPL